MAIRDLQLIVFFLHFTVIISYRQTTALEHSPAVPSPAPQSQRLELNDPLSLKSLFEPILTQLGFHELAMAVPSLHDSPSFSTWSGPSTVFAPSDASINSCSSCSVPRLLIEHIVPGLFSFSYLQTLAFGTRIETISSGRCVTVTSGTNPATNSSKLFINGVEITHPDMFNNGLVVVHGLNGFVSTLSQFSCETEKTASVEVPVQPDEVPPPPSPVMDLMLRDAMLRLRTTGYGILALAMRIKYPDLVSLQNITIFALDDLSIFTGSQSYVSNIRYHIIPNHLLSSADLDKLPRGIPLPTLNKGQFLVVTTAGGPATIRINYISIRTPEVMKNPNIVIHSLFMPFPQLHPESVSSLINSKVNETITESCLALDENGACELIPRPVEDHRGL